MKHLFSPLGSGVWLYRHTGHLEIWKWNNQNGNMGLGYNGTNVESSHCVKQCVWNEWLHRIVNTDSSWNGTKTAKNWQTPYSFFWEEPKFNLFVGSLVFLGRQGKRAARSSQQRAGSHLEMIFLALPSWQRPADILSSPSSCRDGSCMMYKTDQLRPEHIIIFWGWRKIVILVLVYK